MSLLWKIALNVCLLAFFLVFIVDIPDFLVDTAVDKLSIAMVVNLIVQFPLNMFISKVRKRSLYIYLHIYAYKHA